MYVRSFQSCFMKPSSFKVRANLWYRALLSSFVTFSRFSRILDCEWWSNRISWSKSDIFSGISISGGDLGWKDESSGRGGLLGTTMVKLGALVMVFGCGGVFLLLGGGVGLKTGEGGRALLGAALGSGVFPRWLRWDRIPLVLVAYNTLKRTVVGRKFMGQWLLDLLLMVFSFARGTKVYVECGGQVFLCIWITCLSRVHLRLYNFIQYGQENITLPWERCLVFKCCNMRPLSLVIHSPQTWQHERFNKLTLAIVSVVILGKQSAEEGTLKCDVWRWRHRWIFRPFGWSVSRARIHASSSLRRVFLSRAVLSRMVTKMSFDCASWSIKCLATGWSRSLLFMSRLCSAMRSLMFLPVCPMYKWRQTGQVMA